MPINLIWREQSLVFFERESRPAIPSASTAVQAYTEHKLALTLLSIFSCWVLSLFEFGLLIYTQTVIIIIIIQPQLTCGKLGMRRPSRAAGFKSRPTANNLSVLPLSLAR